MTEPRSEWWFVRTAIAYGIAVFVVVATLVMLADMVGA